MFSSWCICLNSFSLLTYLSDFQRNECSSSSYFIKVTYLHFFLVLEFVILYFSVPFRFYPYTKCTSFMGSLCMFSNFLSVVNISYWFPYIDSCQNRRVMNVSVIVPTSPHLPYTEIKVSTPLRWSECEVLWTSFQTQLPSPNFFPSNYTLRTPSTRPTSSTHRRRLWIEYNTE